MAQETHIFDKIAITYVSMKTTAVARLQVQVNSTNEEAFRLKQSWDIPLSKLNVGQIACCLVDKSMGRRDEFKLNTENTMYAVLGDMYLSYYLAQLAFKQKWSAEQFQTSRSKFTSNKNLSSLYDSLGIQYVAVFNVQLDQAISENVKGQVIEALIGVAHEDQKESSTEILEWLCNKVISEKET